MLLYVNEDKVSFSFLFFSWIMYRNGCINFQSIQTKQKEIHKFSIKRFDKFYFYPFLSYSIFAFSWKREDSTCINRSFQCIWCMLAACMRACKCTLSVFIFLFIFLFCSGKTEYSLGTWYGYDDTMFYPYNETVRYMHNIFQWYQQNTHVRIKKCVYFFFCSLFLFLFRFLGTFFVYSSKCMLLRTCVLKFSVHAF